MARSKLTVLPQQGFTLIELVVVTTLSVLLLLTTTSMLITIIQGNTRTTIRKALDDQGDEAIAQMNFFLKNAVNILQNSDGDICRENMKSIKVLTLDETEIQFRQTNNQLVMDRNSITTPMTADNLNLTTDLDIDCFENDNGEKYAHIEFTLEKELTVGFGESQPISQKFKTLIEFRNL